MSGHLDFIYDSETFVDLYSVLEIDMDAKQDEIKTAYISLAKKNHPDQGGSSDKFQEITRAYEILYNKETRKEYDLYYLKKSMDEFKGDDILRLKDEYKNFISANTKPITKEELDKLYSETFDDFREKHKEEKIDDKEFANRINDIEIERKNMQIETSDDSLANFMKEHGQNVNINDVFEYLKFKNANAFNNSIVMKEWGTLDSMPGYSNGYSSFMDDNEYFGSNLYSNISDMNNTMAKNSMDNLNMEEFINWKNTKRADTKLTESDLDQYLKRRQDEQTQLFNEVETNLSNNVKRKEVEKFLKTKHLSEDVERYYNELDDDEKTNKHEKNEKSDKNEKPKKSSKSDKHEKPTSSNLDEMLSYMEKIREEEFGGEKPKFTGEKSKQAEGDFVDLKSNRELPKVNNVRKREFK